MVAGSNSFEWAKYYYQQVIPAIQDRICLEAKDNFNNWLFSVRDLSPKVGQFALAQSAFSQVILDNFRYENIQ